MAVKGETCNTASLCATGPEPTDLGWNKSLASDWHVRLSPGQEANEDLSWHWSHFWPMYLWSLKLNPKEHPLFAHSLLLSAIPSKKTSCFSRQAHSGGAVKSNALIQGKYFILPFNALVLGSLFKHPCPLHSHMDQSVEGTDSVGLIWPEGTSLSTITYYKVFDYN